jgi:hypothetical protein
VKRDYPEIQLSNVITLATRVRICLLKVSRGRPLFDRGNLIDEFIDGCVTDVVSSSCYLQGIAEAYRTQYPAGTATVTQFQPRPQILLRKDRTHCAEAYSFAEAILSTELPRPTKESIR